MPVRGVNHEGDEQADRTVHGGLDKADRPGTYLRILTEGEIGEGDEIRVISQPTHGLTVGDVFRIYASDRHEAERLLDVPQLPDSWRRWAEKWLAREA